MKKLVSLFCLVLELKFIHSSNIPDYIHICKRSDPQVEECVKQAIEKLRPKLKEGIPEVNAPPLEPFSLDNITIFSGNNDTNAIGFRADLYNLEFTGASDFELYKLKLDVNKLIFRAYLNFPKLKIVSDYVMRGKILFVNLDGNGKFYGNVTNVNGIAIIKSKIIDGHMRLYDLDLKFKVGDYHVRLDNLFNGEPVLGKATNDLVNDNKADFLEIILPLLEKETAKKMIEFGNKITDNLIYEEAFPL